MIVDFTKDDDPGSFMRSELPYPPQIGSRIFVGDDSDDSPELIAEVNSIEFCFDWQGNLQKCSVHIEEDKS